VSFRAFAEELDPRVDAGLTLYYQQDGQGFPDLPVSIYRVAEAFPDGTFELIEPFASYPVDIHGITAQEQWQHVAGTLRAYVLADQVMPDRQARTDEEGVARFENLQTGLYLVCEAIAENDSGTYVFNHFMVYLPTPQADGTFDYQVEARPKCTKFVPKTQYTVTKLWQDSGYRDERPTEVTVDIFRDGELWQTQVLNAENNWTYTWKIAGEDHSLWTVTERDVPAPYKVTIRQNGGTFSIINTRMTHPETPKTGDGAQLLWGLMAMGGSWGALVILGRKAGRHS
jgi:hypothetical protein